MLRLMRDLPSPSDKRRSADSDDIETHAIHVLMLCSVRLLNTNTAFFNMIVKLFRTCQALWPQVRLPSKQSSCDHL